MECWIGAHPFFKAHRGKFMGSRLWKTAGLGSKHVNLAKRLKHAKNLFWKKLTSNSCKASVGEDKGGRERHFWAGKSHNLRARQEPSPPTLLWDERGKRNELSLSDLLFCNCFPKQTKTNESEPVYLALQSLFTLLFVKLDKGKQECKHGLTGFHLCTQDGVHISLIFVSTKIFPFLFK